MAAQTTQNRLTKRSPGTTKLALFVCLVGACEGREPSHSESVSSQRIVVEIPPGICLHGIAQRIAATGLASLEQSLAILNNGSLAKTLGVHAKNLEGYIAPHTYQIDRGTTLQDAIGRMIETQLTRLSPPQSPPHGLPLTTHEVLVLASLLEREAHGATEKSRLSAVYRRRLTKNWPLESPTSAVCQPHIDDSQTFDTFRNVGLPSRPVGNPSAESIQAALHPAKTSDVVRFNDSRGKLVFATPSQLLEAFAAIRQDPKPKRITRDTHYVVSNEWNQHHFQQTIRNKGGVFVGVGSDQNYLFAGWSRPQILVLLDFDQMIVDLHSVFRVAFLASSSADEFIQLWSTGQTKRFRGLVRQSIPTTAKARAALRALRFSRNTVAWRLKKLRDTHSRDGVQSLWVDDIQFQFVSALFRANRVVAFRGDLTAANAMADLGKVLRDNGHVVRGLYLSNAEQYFPYTTQFRSNIGSLPFDANSWILRTRPVGVDYTYVLQSYENFNIWLRETHVRSVRDLAPRRALHKTKPVFHVPAEPPPPRMRQRQRRRQHAMRSNSRRRT